MKVKSNNPRLDVGLELLLSPVQQLLGQPPNPLLRAPPEVSARTRGGEREGEGEGGREREEGEGKGGREIYPDTRPPRWTPECNNLAVCIKNEVRLRPAVKILNTS